MVIVFAARVLLSRICRGRSVHWVKWKSLSKTLCTVHCCGHIVHPPVNNMPCVQRFAGGQRQYLSKATPLALGQGEGRLTGEGEGGEMELGLIAMCS